MSMKLNKILLEVETNKFEQDMWKFAATKYFNLSKKYDGSVLEEKFDMVMNDRFFSYKRNNVLLENMDITYIIDETNGHNELDDLLEEFKTLLDDKTFLEEGFSDNATQIVNKAKEVVGSITDKTKSAAASATTAVKNTVDKSIMSLQSKWNKIKDTWTSMLKTFKEWMVAAKLSVRELMTILTNDGFIATFKATFSKLFKGLQKLLILWADTVSKIQNFMFKGLKNSGVGKSLDELGAFLDKKLNQENDAEWKKYARIALGVGVVWLTYYIWTKMFFIGDWRYDFDYSEALGTITGAVDFQSVLGADWIPTLTWFVAGLVSNTFELAVPCPPNCNWFGKWNLVAAGFVTAYIMATNGSLKQIKESDIGKKVQNWLNTIEKDNMTVPTQDKEAKLLINKGGLLHAI